METIESPFMEHQAARLRREHQLDVWRGRAVVAIVAAVCGWVCVAILICL